jgi:hypothetical protein
MAQKNLVPPDDVSAAETARKELERLAVEQHVQPITDCDSFKADFWPQDESLDDFLGSVRDRRKRIHATIFRSLAATWAALGTFSL